MPHICIYGKIVFCEKQNKKELQEIAYDMLTKSITHRFGLLLGPNLPPYRLQKMDLLDCWAGNSLVYEITDDPINNECCDIYDGIWIGEHDYIGIENSRLMDLERFVSDMLPIARFHTWNSVPRMFTGIIKQERRRIPSK